METNQQENVPKSAEAPNTVQDEQQQSTPSQRERLMQRMRAAKPQRQWDDEEAFFKAINDDYDEREILQELYDEQEKEHALALEAAVAAAAHEGEVRGRNLKIEQQLRHARQPEHIHNLDGSPASSASYRERPELGALNRVGYQSIWERGREVRIKN